MPHPQPVPGFVARDILRLSRRNGWVMQAGVGDDADGAGCDRQTAAGAEDAGADCVGRLKTSIVPLDQAETMHRLIPQSQLDVIAGCGHLAPLRVHEPDRAEGGAVREAVMGRRGAAVANTWFDWLQSARVDALISALRNSQKWLIQGRLNMPPIARSGTATSTYYRFAHWPIWIWVFFLAPGPLTFSLFSRGFHWLNWAWLAAVLIGTGIAGYYGQLPGVEPAPYILRFDEDKPNPLYRRVCYTFAWNAALNFALLNMAGLAYAAGHRHLAPEADLPLCLLAALRADFAAGHAGQAATRGAFNQGRRAGAPLFLRFSVGSVRGANR